MKTIILACIMITSTSIVSFGDNRKYTLDESKMNEVFSQADDISLTANQVSSTFLADKSIETGDQTKSGFLLRAFFCGGFALHRSYMGTNGLFIKYFCTFGVIGCVDFWWTIIKGDEAFNTFKGNDKWIVWNDKK